MKQKIINILYATGIGTKPTFVKESECTIGSIMSDPGAVASCRPAAASAAIAPVKISYVIQCLTLLLDTKCPAYCRIGDALYVETDGKRAVLTKPQDGYVMKRENGFPTTARQVLTAILIYEVTLHADETKESLKKCLESYNKTGSVPAVLVGALCDAFYYELKIKSDTTIELLDTPLEEAELDAMQRQDSPQEITIPGSAMPKPKQIRSEIKTAKKPVKRLTPSETLEKAKKGEYLVPYEWKEETESYRPGLSILDDFIPNQIFTALLEKTNLRTRNVLTRIREEGLDLSNPADRVRAIGKDYINVSLSGKPGTGKTRLGYAIGGATGMPVYTIPNSHNTDEDAYTGMTKMVDGQPMSVATDVVKCFEEGGILLLEEINLPQAAVVMGALGQALEFPFILMKDGYQPIRRHPLCIIISTMNTGTAGSKAVSQPFANRFKQSFVLDDPTKEDFIRILANTGAEIVVCRWVYECYERIVAGIENDNAMADVESILLSLSVRTCIGAIENIQEGMEPREAVMNSIIGKISEQDREVAKACAKIVDGMRDPSF